MCQIATSVNTVNGISLYAVNCCGGIGLVNGNGNCVLGGTGLIVTTEYTAGIAKRLLYGSAVYSNGYRTPYICCGTFNSVSAAVERAMNGACVECIRVL